MKHDEFQVKGHRFENEIKIDSLNQWLICMTTRALLRVNLRGAFFRTKKYIPAVNFCKTVNLILEESIMDKNYKPITSIMVVVKLIIRILLLPVYISLTIVQLVVMFVTWLSATIFHILSGIICITAILGYGFGQETGTETIRMLAIN